MSEVLSPHIWYPYGYPGSGYDLRKIDSWFDADASATTVKVHFRGDSATVVEFNKVAFEAAKEASMAAAAIPLAPEIPAESLLTDDGDPIVTDDGDPLIYA